MKPSLSEGQLELVSGVLWSLDARLQPLRVPQISLASADTPAPCPAQQELSCAAAPPLPHPEHHLALQGQRRDTACIQEAILRPWGIRNPSRPFLDADSWQRGRGTLNAGSVSSSLCSPTRASSGGFKGLTELTGRY